MKVVLDANVLMSGLMYRASVPGKIVDAWRESRFDLVMTIEQLSEIGRVLAYPKIHRLVRWNSAMIESFLRQLYLRSELLDLSGATAAVPKDRGDDFILSALIAGSADWLVTGDGDLLELRARYPIVTPAEFAARLV